MKINLTKILNNPIKTNWLNREPQTTDASYLPLKEDTTGEINPYSFELERDEK